MRVPRKAAAACVGLSLLLCSANSAAAEQWRHPLFRAIERGDTALLHSLLREGAEVNVRRPDGTTPLMFAALRGSAEHVRMLLEQGADATAINREGVTALLWGAGDLDKVRMLLEHGADVNARSSLGNTPLQAAAAHPGGSAIVALMLEHGADPTIRNRRDLGPLHAALTAIDAPTVKLLLSREDVLPTDAAQYAHQFGKLIDVAAGSGSEEILDLLLEHARQRLGNTPVSGDFGLQAALLAQRPTMVRRLIECGAPLDQPTPAGRVPPLLLAAYTEIDDASAVRVMLEHGVDVTARNDAGETALTWARRRGHPELIDVLLQAGAPEAADVAPDIPHRSLDLQPENQSQLIRQAVQKSLQLMQSSSDTFLKERSNCVSCHHQNLTGVALAWARDRGFSVDQASLQRMVERQAQDWRKRVERAFQMDPPGPVVERFFGYGLWSFSALGFEDPSVTEPFVWYLAQTQQPAGWWDSGMVRPPMGGGAVTATVLAMRALQLYPLSSQVEDLTARVQRAAQWLAQVQPQHHQERTLQLLGLAWSGAPQSHLQDRLEQLVAAQRSDGGWSQLEHLPSDAWATGQALVALHAAGVTVDRPAYRRGMEFLLRTQFDDGSWFVKSRTWPFQPPFESGFPHGRDQWISCGATAWAVMGLVLAVEPREQVVVPDGPLPEFAADAPSDAASKSASDPATKATPLIDFASEIRPVLQRSCTACHSGDQPASGFRVTDRRSLLAGGESDLEAVVPGNAAASPLLRFVSGADASLQMPPLDRRQEFPQLTPAELAALQAWIDQGARWPAGVEVRAAAAK